MLHHGQAVMRAGACKQKLPPRERARNVVVACRAHDDRVLFGPKHMQPPLNGDPGPGVEEQLCPRPQRQRRPFKNDDAARHLDRAVLHRPVRLKCPTKSAVRL